MLYEERLPKEPTAAATARRVIERLSDQLDRDQLQTAQLLVSELCANAVRHVDAEGEIRLVVELDDGRLRVEVADPGVGFEPRARGPESPADSGWGLHFVRVLSTRWGASVNGRSKVWFELPVHTAA